MSEIKCGARGFGDDVCTLPKEHDGECRDDRPRWICPNCGIRLHIDPDDKTPMIDPFYTIGIRESTQFEIVKREHEHYCKEIMADPIMRAFVPGPSAEG